MSRLVAAGVLPESFKLQNKAPTYKKNFFLAKFNRTFVGILCNLPFESSSRDFCTRTYPNNIK